MPFSKHDPHLQTAKFCFSSSAHCGRVPWDSCSVQMHPGKSERLCIQWQTVRTYRMSDVTAPRIKHTFPFSTLCGCCSWLIDAFWCCHLLFTLNTPLCQTHPPGVSEGGTSTLWLFVWSLKMTGWNILLSTSDCTCILLGHVWWDSAGRVSQSVPGF